MRRLWARVLVYGRMIRFSHSVFALPFGLTSAVLGAREGITPRQVLWIVVAMVAARSAAMGMNRLADHAQDARNPRTAGRELPRGLLTRREVWVFVILSAAVLVLAAGMLNPLCLALSPLALAIVFGYSYTKRFTAASHLLLGLALAVGPVGAVAPPPSVGPVGVVSPPSSPPHAAATKASTATKPMILISPVTIPPNNLGRVD